MANQHPNSEIPAFHPPFKYRLQKFPEKLNVDGPVKIVAIGSSSTAGEGGIAPYPCRLDGALREPALFHPGDRAAVQTIGRRREPTSSRTI
jgi:hypothetical protein